MRGAALHQDGDSSPWPVPSMVPAWRGVNGMTEPPRPPSPHQAGLPVDGIVHDEHFVLIPGPFFFLQRKKLKMSTSDAALEIKDRAETVQGQNWEALVTALLLLPCNPHQGPDPAGDQRCPTSPPTGPSRPLLYPHQDWLSHPMGTWLHLEHS